jgi:hypothetical protein
MAFWLSWYHSTMPSGRHRDLSRIPVDDPTLKSVEIYTDGKASERVKSELSQRSIRYQSVPLVQGK